MRLIFLGPPGAGKGTIAVKVKEAYQIPHISTGDLFREAIANQTPLGKKVKAILDSGELVPDEVTVEMVKERLSRPDVKGGYILDGFPRTTGQADALKAFASVDKVLNFVLSEEKIVERLSGRRIAKKSGRVYHIQYNPPAKEGICDESGEPLIQRPDDKPEAIKNRLRVYAKQTAPLIDYYQKREVSLISMHPHPPKRCSNWYERPFQSSHSRIRERLLFRGIQNLPDCIRIEEVRLGKELLYCSIIREPGLKGEAKLFKPFRITFQINEKYTCKIKCSFSRKGAGIG